MAQGITLSSHRKVKTAWARGNSGLGKPIINMHPISTQSKVRKKAPASSTLNLMGRNYNHSKRCLSFFMRIKQQFFLTGSYKSLLPSYFSGMADLPEPIQFCRWKDEIRALASSSWEEASPGVGVSQLPQRACGSLFQLCKRLPLPAHISHGGGECGLLVGSYFLVFSPSNPQTYGTTSQQQGDALMYDGNNWFVLWSKW